MNNHSRLLKISFIVLAIISGALTANLFVLFSDSLIGKILAGVLGLSLEIIKVESLLLWRDKKTLSIFILYILLAGFSLIASTGYALQQVEKYNLETQTKNENKTLNEINKQIDYLLKLNDRLVSSTNYIYYTRSLRLQKEVKKLREEKAKLVPSKIKDPDKNPDRNPDRMFVLLGGVTGVKPSAVKLILLLLMALVIEYSLMVLSGKFRIRVKTRKRKRIPKTKSLSELIKESKK